MNDQFVLILNQSYLNSGKPHNSGQFMADQTFHYIESTLYFKWKNGIKVSFQRSRLTQNHITRYQKILLLCSFGCKNLLNFICHLLKSSIQLSRLPSPKKLSFAKFEIQWLDFTTCILPGPKTWALQWQNLSSWLTGEMRGPDESLGLVGTWLGHPPGHPNGVPGQCKAREVLD